MSKLLQAVQMIQQAALGLPPGSPLHRDSLKAAQSLSRHLPQGAPSIGVQKTGAMDLIRQITQSGFLQQILGQRGQGGGGPGPPGGGGPAQNAPSPSMPLPGA
jgi:hypothetical protein